MKEVEILCNLKDDLSIAENKILNYVFKDGDRFYFKGEKRVIDTYYNSKKFSDFDMDINQRLSASFRIREKDSICYITYKYDNFNSVGEWIYSDEFETEIGDVKVFKDILNKIYFEELVKIDNTKRVFVSNNYELVLERVVGLGNFLEIEFKSKSEIKDEDVLNIKQDIRDLISVLDIDVGDELNSGKPELMLKNIS